jgi:hypothetical protein
LDNVDLDEEDEDNYVEETTNATEADKENQPDNNITSQSLSSMNSSLHISNKLVPLSDETNTKEERAVPEPEQPTEEENSDVETEDLVHLEPKLRDAYIKMRKLDKKLVQVLKKERKVRNKYLKLYEYFVEIINK